MSAASRAQLKRGHSKPSAMLGVDTSVRCQLRPVAGRNGSV